MWHVGQAEPFSRRTRTTTIQRPEAFKLQVGAFSDTVTPIAEIVELVTKIRDVAARLDALATEYGSRRHQ
jgi:hypothetical protein